MPYVFLYLRSRQRDKPISDRPRVYRFKARCSGDMYWGAVEWKPGRFKLNAVPDRYGFQLSIPEFERINGEFDVSSSSRTGVARSRVQERLRDSASYSQAVWLREEFSTERGEPKPSDRIEP